MADTLYRLDEWIERVRSIPELARESAPDVAAEVEADLDAQIRAGKDPTGRAWAPRKADGGKPLEGAEKSLVVVPVGTTIFARLRGHVARHHLGRAKGGTVRQILPVDGLPDSMAERVRGVLTRRFHERMAGG